MAGRELGLCQRVMAAELLPIADRSSHPPVDPSDTTRLALQRAAILREMTQAGLGTADEQAARRRTLVEFGAGEGTLSRELWRAGAAADVILVDRSERRPPQDPIPSGAERRLCMDVRALSAEQLRAMVVGEAVLLSNHCCGSALDISVQCAARAFAGERATRLSGIVAVTCCHHLCSWRNYLGRDALAEWGFDASDFELLRRWSRLAYARATQPNAPSTQSDPTAQTALNLPTAR